MKKHMNQEIIETSIRLPQYSTCRVCRYFISEVCGPCQSDPNLTYFEARRGITFFDLPALPPADDIERMPAMMVRKVFGLYLEKNDRNTTGAKMIDKIMTIPQVAEYLQVSKAKIYLMIQRGEIPYIRLDRNVRVKESELMKWLEKQTVPTRKLSY